MEVSKIVKRNEKNNFLYFFIDVYNSRKFFGHNQDITNSILKALAKHLNKKFSVRLLSSFEVRDGDGVLGGTKELSLLVDIYESCLEFKQTKEFESINLNGVESEKVKFYFGAGIGDITTNPSTFDSVHNINGTAISNAKKASDVAKDIIIYNSLPKREIPIAVSDSINKRGNYYYRWQDIQFYLITDSNLDKLLNPNFYLAYEKYVSNKKQNELYQIRKRYPNLDLYRIGEKLNYKLESDVNSRQKLSTQISNLLNKSNFYSQQNLLRDIRIYLSEISYDIEELD